jgi:tight adherence protein B
MVISAEPIIYGLIFLAVLALVQGIYLTVFGKSISLNNRVNRRMQMLESGAGREQVLEQLRKEMSQHMKSKSIPLYSILAEKAQKANIAFTPSQLIMVMAILTVVSFVLLTFGTTAVFAIRAVLSVVMGVGAVFVWVNNTAKKRLGMIEEQLPDAVELMVLPLN